MLHGKVKVEVHLRCLVSRKTDKCGHLCTLWNFSRTTHLSHLVVELLQHARLYRVFQNAQVIDSGYMVIGQQVHLAANSISLYSWSRMYTSRCKSGIQVSIVRSSPGMAKQLGRCRTFALLLWTNHCKE